MKAIEDAKHIPPEELFKTLLFEKETIEKLSPEIWDEIKVNPELSDKIQEEVKINTELV